MNLEIINKWLENEFGVSYTRLEELHDFVVEQDLKHQEEKDKVIEELQKKVEQEDHYKHLYSEVKKQKDDVAELIKKIPFLYSPFKEEVLRMLGEKDD